MIFRFLFETVIGIICLLAIVFFGEKGISSIALFALLPILMRIRKIKKPDERELQLFYKTGNLTMGLMILAIMLIGYFSDTIITGHLVGDNWMILCVVSVIFIHGLAGLIVFKKS